MGEDDSDGAAGAAGTPVDSEVLVAGVLASGVLASRGEEEDEKGGENPAVGRETHGGGPTQPLGLPPGRKGGPSCLAIRWRSAVSATGGRERSTLSTGMEASWEKIPGIFTPTRPQFKEQIVKHVKSAGIQRLSVVLTRSKGNLQRK
jgi:hypothetical protein